MVEDSILLITDDDIITENVLSKLVLLRESDNIAVCNYSSAGEILKNSNISIVIVQEKNSESDTIDFLKTIISENYDTILLLNECKSKLILAAYDLGVVDYFTVNSPDYEMLIKTINAFKYRTLKLKSLRDIKFLKYLGAVDLNTGFYKYKFCKELLAEFVEDIKIKSGMFIILSVDDTSKSLLTSDILANAIKSVVRGDDIISVVQSSKFYILLPNIDKNGACTVIDKIQNILLGQKIIIRAGICEISGKSFSQLEREAFTALTEASNRNETFVYLDEQDKTLDDWLTPEEKNEKYYKLFNNAYNNKLEKVIAPVFFRLQKAYEGKLFNTEIIQYTEDMQSVFSLKNKTHESKIKIIYPGFAKIVVYVEHSGLDTPDNKEFQINLNEITQQGLSKIVEDFIEEFKSTIK